MLPALKLRVGQNWLGPARLNGTDRRRMNKRGVNWLAGNDLAINDLGGNERTDAAVCHGIASRNSARYRSA